MSSSWEKRNSYALVIKDSEGVESPYDLRLQVGDIVCLRGEYQGWYKGSVYINENNLRIAKKREEEYQKQQEELKKKELEDKGSSNNNTNNSTSAATPTSSSANPAVSSPTSETSPHVSSQSGNQSASSSSSMQFVKPLENNIYNRGFIPSTHVILLDDASVSRRQTQRKSIVSRPLANVLPVTADSVLNSLGQSKKKKLEPLDFMEEKRELELHARDLSWWDTDLAIPFCKLTLDVMTDWSRHFVDLMNEENADVLERIFEVLCKLTSGIAQFKKALTENNQEKMKSLEGQQLKIVEQGCIILDEDVVPKNKGLIMNETNTTLIKLYRLYWDAMKKERDATNELKAKRRKKISERQESKSKGFRPALLGGPKSSSSSSSVQSKEFYNLPDGNTQMLIQINECAFGLNDKIEVVLNLYSGLEKKFVSEEFMFILPRDNCAISAEDVKRVVVQDMGGKDFQRELYLVARIYRKGQMLRDQKVKDSQKMPQELKRPYGCSILELSPSTVSSLMSGDVFSCDPLPVFIPTKEENFYMLHEFIVEAKSSEFEQAPSSEIIKGLSITLQSQIGDYEDVLEKIIEWADIRTCKLTNFPMIVSPGDMRNDIYITLGNGNFKTSDAKNVMVEARVVYKPSQKGNHIKAEPVKCITGAVNVNTTGDQTTNYQSTVYYHNKSPKWNETFKVNIDPENLDKATVVFLFSNCASRHSTVKPPFAIAAWKMTDKRGLLNLNSKLKTKSEDDPTGEFYTLSVYKYSKQLEDEIYDFSEMHELRSKLMTKSTLNIKHTIVSTRVTQNENLKNLLNWSEVTGKSKKEILDLFLFCQMEEKVTFLREIFDAMFSIMDQHDEKDVAILIYQAMTEIVGNLVSQRKFERYRDIMDQYIAKHFHSLQVQKWFLHFLLFYLDNLKDKSMATKLGESIKGLDYLFKFIVKSRQQYETAIQKGEKVSPDEVLESTSFYVPKHKQVQQQQLDAISENDKKDSPTSVSDQKESEQQQKKEAEENADTITDHKVEQVSKSESTEQVQQVSSSDNSVDQKPTIDISAPTIVVTPQTVGSEESVPISEVLPKNEFQKKILYLLDRIYELLNSEEKFLIGAQGNLLKFVGSLFDSLAEVFDPIQVGYVSVTFLSEIPKPTKDRSLLVVGKLNLITQMVKGKVFKQIESRRIVLPKIIEELQFHFNREPAERQSCIQIFSELMHAVQKIYNDDGWDAIKDSMYTIFSLIPQAKEALEQISSSATGLKQTIDDIKNPSKSIDKTKISITNLETEFQTLERLRADLLNALLAMVYMYRTDELIQYHCKCDESTATGMSVDTIKHFFFLYDLFLSEDNPIPGNFISFNVIMYRSILSNMTVLANYMKLNLLEEKKFSAELWETLFKNIFKYVFAPYIQLELSTSFKQAKILAQAGTDLRKVGLELILDVWNAMGSMQEHFVPALINPIMKVFDIRNEELHRAAVNLYYGVLKQEYSSHKTVERCEGVTQRCIIERTVDDLFKRSFMQGLADKFESDPDLGPSGLEFLNRLDTMLADVVKIQQYANDEDLKTQACIQVMESLKSNGNIELYLKYVHILSNMHVKFGNHIEAALSLKLHYDTLSWNNQTRLPYFSEDYPEETAKIRKEKMIKKMIQLFNEGKDWERAIELCKELRRHYEETYSYSQIEEVLKEEGSFYTSIMTKKRFGAAYFYVRYYGQGFKSLGLQGEYIYRGKELENHVDFANKLGAKYPLGKVLFKQPSEEVDNDPGMFIYAYTVVPSDDQELNNVFTHRNYEVSPKISRYARMNNIKYVTVTRRYRESNEETKNEYKDMHREIKFFCLEDTYPNIKRRMRIVDIKYLNLIPLENAMKDIEDKVNELQDSVISHMMDVRPDTNELSMLLNGTIDAAVNGGISKYLDAFFTQEYKDAHPEHKDTIDRFRRAMFAQMDVLREGLIHRRRHVTGKALALNEHLEGMYEKMKKQMANI